MDKKALMILVEKHLDIPGLMVDVLEGVLEPALDKMVADSSNPYDDALKMALYPALKPILLAQVAKMWDKVDGEEKPA